ncbi:MAG: ATP-binding protein [Rhodoferax sp.]
MRAESGALTHFVGILSDVTARVQAEAANAERRAQLDAIFGLSPDGFVLFDAQEQLVFANPAFEHLTGLAWSKPGDAMGLDDFAQALAARSVAPHAALAIRALDVSGETAQLRLELVRPQRRVLQIRARHNTEGRRETIVYFRDVTHEDEVDRMKSEFLASAAHELRTPMVSIFGFTELLLRRRFTPERQADMLDTIHRQSGRLVNMINELLDLARIESRRGLDLQIVDYPLRDLVDNTVRGLMRKDSERQVVVGAIPDVPVLADPEKMQLALTNLLSNAFKYSPHGGDVTLDCRIEQRGGTRFALLEVRDHGIGMTPEQVERAFERFYRADKSGNIPGTGLGLSLVKEVAELHKGQVRLESEAGQGTTARLWIPLPQEAEPQDIVVQDSVFA